MALRLHYNTIEHNRKVDRMFCKLDKERLQLIRAIRQLTLRHSIQGLQCKSTIQLKFILVLLEDGVDV